MTDDEALVGRLLGDESAWGDQGLARIDLIPVLTVALKRVRRRRLARRACSALGGVAVLAGAAAVVAASSPGTRAPSGGASSELAGAMSDSCSLALQPFASGAPSRTALVGRAAVAGPQPHVGPTLTAEIRNDGRTPCTFAVALEASSPVGDVVPAGGPVYGGFGGRPLVLAAQHVVTISLSIGTCQATQSGSAVRVTSVALIARGMSGSLRRVSSDVEGCSPLTYALALVH